MTSSTKQKTTQTNEQTRVIASKNGREALALEALHELIVAFSRNDSLKELAESLVFSACGQFSTANAFVCIKNPEGSDQEPVYFGAGQFTHRRSILTASFECDELLTPGESIRYLGEANSGKTWSRLETEWQNAGVQLVGQINHKGRVAGFVGLGSKIDMHTYSEEDIELFTTLIDTISPPVSGIFAYAEYAHLNNWYENVLNSVNQGVVVIDSQGVIRVVNEAARKLFMSLMPDIADQSAIVGRHGHDMFCSTNFPGWCDVFMNARSHKDSPLAQETMVARSDHGDLIFSVMVSGVKNSMRGSDDLIITMQDVTEEKETQRHLFELEKIAEKGVMFSSITHELNNFLGMILGGVELIQIQMAKGNMEKVTSSLERLKGNAERLERFTASLMNYGHLDSRKSNAGLNDVISDVITFLMAQKRFARIDIQTKYDFRLPRFEFDTDEISQLLINLFNNAADAIAEKGKGNGRITIATSTDSGSVVLIVSDNGCGMTPELKDKLFRAHFTTKKNGHGYGLVTCAKIISNHDGDVNIESAPGEGTTFTFRFPLKKSE